VPEVEARRDLDRALDAIGNRILDGHPHVEVAAALALGKGGDPSARSRLLAEERLALRPADRFQGQVEARMASLVAVGLLPRNGDEELIIRWLRSDDGKMRRAAALAASLQGLADPAPDWVASPQRVLQALRGASVKMHLDDGAEAAFARGVFAHQAGSRTEWKALFDLATTPSTEDRTKRAAAQALLFCEDPFFLQAAANYVSSSTKKDPVVLAAFLQRLAQTGTRQGLDVCAAHLRNAGRFPKARPDWDVRFHVVIGLLRALSAGRANDAQLRRDIDDSLQAAVTRGLAKGPFRDALKLVLDNESRFIRERPGHVVPEKRIHTLEASFKDMHGLLARDFLDLAVVRLNDLMPTLFNVNNPKPGAVGDRDKSEIPRRFLKACYERFPYFSRLDLRADRGRREWPHMPKGDDPQREVHRK
jgi:hypothetical protein